MFVDFSQQFCDKICNAFTHTHASTPRFRSAAGKTIQYLLLINNSVEITTHIIFQSPAFEETHEGCGGENVSCWGCVEWNIIQKGDKEHGVIGDSSEIRTCCGSTQAGMQICPICENDS